MLIFAAQHSYCFFLYTHIHTDIYIYIFLIRFPYGLSQILNIVSCNKISGPCLSMLCLLVCITDPIFPILPSLTSLPLGRHKFSIPESVSVS